MNSPRTALKASFAPVVDARTRLLVLGSLPGEQSLAKSQYYANPRNQFWRLIGTVIGIDLATREYSEQLEALRQAHVGLWDVVASATREGSLDAAIRGHEANDLDTLIRQLPELRAIAFNGGTAARIGSGILSCDTPFALLPLPSSSPAYTLPFERKRDAWLALRAFL